MKSIIVIISIFITTNVFAQIYEFETMLDSAKILFNSSRGSSQNELDQFSYSEIVDLLNGAINLEPDNPEARYFLGYAYSRINSQDGRGMVNMDLDILFKASEQFEKVIELSPKYTGEIITLDPHTKLTAEWGSMAMKYWHSEKLDSSVWAFKEGVRRGGFGEYTLRIGKEILDACNSDAILISSGDIITFPLWYLQIVDGYRKDISIVDVNLLNSIWYPKFLCDNNILEFSQSCGSLDSIGYTEWSDKNEIIGDFTWTLKPSYGNKYLLRGDRILLSMLKKNNFHRDIYFTKGIPESSKLSLQSYMSSLLIIDMFTPAKKITLSYKEYSKSMKSILKLSKYINLNNLDEIRILDSFRYNILGYANELNSNNKKRKAKRLIKLLDKYANDQTIPYSNENGEEYLEYIRQIIE